MAKQFCESLNLINRPDLWEVGTEYDFGSGLYGQRFAGTFGEPTQVDRRLTYAVNTAVSASKIVNSGGNFVYSVSTSQFTVNSTSTFMDSDASVQTAGSVVTSTIFNGIRIQLLTRVTFSTLPQYDIWVLYKK